MMRNRDDERFRHGIFQYRQAPHIGARAADGRTRALARAPADKKAKDRALGGPSHKRRVNARPRGTQAILRRNEQPLRPSSSESVRLGTLANDRPPTSFQSFAYSRRVLTSARGGANGAPRPTFPGWFRHRNCRRCGCKPPVHASAARPRWRVPFRANGGRGPIAP
jgi:hypothetical protein